MLTLTGESSDIRILSDLYTSDQVRKVLKDCNVNIASEIDGEYIVFCPFHNNYRSPAAEVSKSMGTLYCFGCHANKSLIEIVQHTQDKTIFQAMRAIAQYAKPGSLIDQVEAMLTKPAEEYKEFPTDVVERLHMNMLESPKAQSYMLNRKIDLDSVRRYQIGYSQVQDMVTVPMHSPTGICVGFVARSIQGKAFKNSDHLPKSKILFNLHRNRLHDKIVIVESTFDAIRLEQCGHHAVATLGSSISKVQIDLLDKTFYQVILIPDADDAGKMMAEKLVNKLGSRVTIAKLPSGTKDVGDLSDEDIRYFMNTIDPLEAFITT